MRFIGPVLAATAALSFAGAAHAADSRMTTCAAQWKAMPHGSQTYKQFMTTCLHVGTPAAPPTPVGPAAATAAKAPVQTPSALNASALCKDGSYSMSGHATNACSHHGGVAKRLK